MSQTTLNHLDRFESAVTRAHELQREAAAWIESARTTNSTVSAQLNLVAACKLHNEAIDELLAAILNDRASRENPPDGDGQETPASCKV